MPAWGVYVGQSVHSADFRAPEMRHRYLKLLYLHQGAATLRLDDHAHRCQSGDLVIVPIGRSHAFEDQPGAPVALYMLAVRPGVVRHEPGVLARLPGGVVRLSERDRAMVNATFRRLLFEQSRAAPGCAVMMSALAGRLLVDLMRRPAPSDAPPRHVAARDKVLAYLNRLEHRFFDPGTLGDAAAELGVSRRRFTQLCREITGTSWRKHVRNLRMEHARQLLGHADRTITAIAFECGYNDLSTFYRDFRAIEDRSPSAYRAAMRDGPQA